MKQVVRHSCRFHKVFVYFQFTHDFFTASGEWAAVEEFRSHELKDLLSQLTPSSVEGNSNPQVSSTGSDVDYSDTSSDVELGTDLMTQTMGRRDNVGGTRLKSRGSTNGIGGARAGPNGTLVFLGVTRDHEGRYLCQATNGVGPGLSKVITLTVHGKYIF